MPRGTGVAQLNGLIAFFLCQLRPRLALREPILAPVGFAKCRLRYAKIRILLQRFARHQDGILHILRLGEVQQVPARLQVIIVRSWLAGTVKLQSRLFVRTQLDLQRPHGAFCYVIFHRKHVAGRHLNGVSTDRRSGARIQ